MDVVRGLAAAVGAMLVVSSGWSVVGTVVVPRRIRGWLTHAVGKAVNNAFHLAADRSSEYRLRDRILAAQAPVLLLAQMVAWLGVFELGFGLMLWPFAGSGGLGSAFEQIGSSICTLGYLAPHTQPAAAIDDLAALAGLVTIALQIGYLPTLYSAFNRRETLVTMLESRAGVPSWGPELLARTHFGLGTGVSLVEELPNLFDRWESWAADVSESHATYPPLVAFRSPNPNGSWVTGLLAVLDAAALYLSLLSEPLGAASARLCLRGGFSCLGTVARALGLDIPDDPGPDDGIRLTYAEFQYAVERLREVDFPIGRRPEDAWPEFVGWRVNYEAAAYAIAWYVDAPPAMWSGPRRIATPEVPPHRPALRRALRRGPAKS